MRIDQMPGMIENRDLISSLGLDADTQSQVSKDGGIYGVGTNENAGNLSATSMMKGFFDGSGSDILEEAQQVDVDVLKDKLAVLSNVMSPEDFAHMMDEGIDVTDEPIDTIVTVSDKIKMALLEAGVDISDWGGTPLSSSEIEAMGGSAADIARLKEAYAGLDIPATSGNIKEGLEALEMARGLEPVSKAAEKYMLSNGMTPTIENIYTAGHAASAEGQMEDQVKRILSGTSFGDTPGGLNTAKWMITQGIPFTPENVELAYDLENMSFPLDEEKVMGNIASAVMDGYRPKDAVLTEGPSIMERAKAAVDVLKSATEKEVEQLEREAKPVTIETLRWAAEHPSEGTGKGSGDESKDFGNQAPRVFEPAEEANETAEDSAKDSRTVVAGDLEHIKNLRALEELRLSMTLQGAYHLAKSGIEIETRSLSDLVDDLKSMERELSAGVFRDAGVEDTEENHDLYERTLKVAQELPSLPAYSLGARKIEETTMGTLHEDGLKIREALMAKDPAPVSRSAMPGSALRALGQYETLMTQPNKDLGDSIEKAFSNVDDILEDIGEDINESNRAYNSSDITPESVEKMKAADAKVQVMMKEMTPQAALHLIKKGLNPLDMNVTDLSRELASIREENGYNDTADEARFLWDLQQKHDITEDERSAYMGIYRLFSQIEQSDGAVIGQLVEQGAPITMRNLLTSVKTRSAEGMEVTIDKEYGVIESLDISDDTIAAQLEKGFVNASDMRTYVSETTDYMQDLARQGHHLSDADTMEGLAKQGMADMTLEEAVETMQQSREDTSDADARYSRQLYEQFMENTTPEDTVLRLLSSNNEAVSMFSQAAAGEMIYNRNGLYKDISKGLKDEKLKHDLAEAKEALIEALGEGAKAPAEMAKAEEELADLTEKAARDVLPPARTLTHDDIMNLKLMSTQIKLTSALAKNEQYAIPVNVEGEDGTIHLQIVRNDEDRGRVNIVFETESLGKVASELSFVKGKIEGVIIADNEKATQTYRQRAADFHRLMVREGATDGTNVSLKFITDEGIDLSAFEMREKTHALIEGSSRKEDEEYEVQTKTLYGMSKAFIRGVIRASEG